MNSILQRWDNFTQWFSRYSGQFFLSLTFLALAAHQGTGLPSGFLAVVCFLLALWRLPLETKSSAPQLWLTGLILVSVGFSFATHPVPGAVFVTALPFVMLSIGVGLGYRLPEQQRPISIALIAALAVACAAWGLPARWQALKPYESWFNDYNSAATLFNLGIFSSLALAVSTKGFVRKAMFGVAIVLGTAIGYSASRGGLLTLAIGLVLLGIHQRNALTRFKRLVLPVAIVGVGSLGLLAARSGMLERLSRLGSDESTFARLSMWKAGWQMAQDNVNWVMGYGLGMWAQLYPAYRSGTDFESAGFMAHNDYVQTFVEGGPLLCTALVLFAGTAAWLAVHRQSSARGAALAAGVTLASVHATFNFPFYNAQLTVVLGLMLGLALAENKAIRVNVGKFGRDLITGQALMLVVALPFIFWMALEAVTNQAAFASGTWPSRLIPNAGKVEVVEALFGTQAERAITTAPAKTLATHYLGMAIGRTEDSLEVRRATLNKAIAVYANARETAPGAFIPAQTHLLYRGAEAGLFEKAETVKRVKSLLEPLIAKYPARRDLHISWADALLMESGYATAEAYLDEQQKKMTTLDFDRKVSYWKRSRNPALKAMTNSEMSRAGVGIR